MRKSNSIHHKRSKFLNEKILLNINEISNISRRFVWNKHAQPTNGVFIYLIYRKKLFQLPNE